MTDLFDITIALIQGLGLMALLTLLLGAIERRLGSTLAAGIVIGALFAGGSIVAMSAPLTLSDGVLIDARLVIVSLSTAAGGPIAGLIVGAASIAYRSWLGGVGAPAGCLGIAIATGAGLLWHLGAHRRLAEVRSHDLLMLGGLTSLAILSILTLPAGMGWSVLAKAGPPMFLAQIAGTLVLGLVMRREKRLVAAERSMRREAGTDALTGLCNRRRFDLALAEAIARAGSERAQPAVLLIDADRFKAVNDTHGHAAGDAVLRILASRVAATVRRGDMVARFGGEEFAVLLAPCTLATAQTIAARVRTAVAASPFVVDGRPLTVTVSIGVAGLNANAWDRISLIEAADRSLYRAKAGGRNRVGPLVTLPARRPDAAARPVGAEAPRPQRPSQLAMR